MMVSVLPAQTGLAELGTTLQPDLAFTQNVTFGSLTFILFLVTVFGNITLILVILKTPHLRTITNSFILSLATADLLLGFFIMPFSASLALNGAWTYGSSFCQMTSVIHNTCTTAILVSLMMVSIDRCLAVALPLKYNLIITWNIAGLMIAIVWTYSLIFALMPVFGWGRADHTPHIFTCSVVWHSSMEYVITYYTFCIILPSLILTSMFISILKYGYAQKRIFAFLPMPVGSVLAFVPPPVSSYRRSTLSAMKTLFIIIAMLTLLWLPYTVVKLLLYSDYDVTSAIVTWTCWVATCSSAVNPLVFLSNRKFNQLLRDMYCKYCSGSRGSVLPGVLNQTTTSSVPTAIDGPSTSGLTTLYNNNIKAINGTSNTLQVPPLPCVSRKVAPPEEDSPPKGRPYHSLRRGSATISLRQAMRVKPK